MKIDCARPQEEVSRIEGVRRELPAGIDIRLDANGSWNVAEASEALSRFARPGVQYIEEPVSGPSALAALRASSPLPIAADESVLDLGVARQLVETHAVDVLILKPTLLGLAASMELAGMADRKGMRVVVTSSLETSVAEGGLGLGTLLLVLLVMRFGSDFLSRTAILVGLVAGSAIGAAMGMSDFSGVGTAGWFSMPLPFAFGPPTFTVAACAAMTVTMLVTMVESTGDYLAIGEVCEQSVDEKRLAAGLRAEGIGTMIGGLMNAFPFTTFSQNIGVIRVSGVRSRYVVAITGGMLVALSLAPKAAALVANVPTPVLGGCGLVLFGSIAATGIQTLRRVDFEHTGNVLTVGISLGAAMLVVANPIYFSALPKAVADILNNPITLGAVCAVTLNLVFNGRGRAARD